MVAIHEDRENQVCGLGTTLAFDDSRVPDVAAPGQPVASRSSSSTSRRLHHHRPLRLIHLHRHQKNRERSTTTQSHSRTSLQANWQIRLRRANSNRLPNTTPANIRSRNRCLGWLPRARPRIFVPTLAPDRAKARRGEISRKLPEPDRRESTGSSGHRRLRPETS